MRSGHLFAGLLLASLAVLAGTAIACSDDASTAVPGDGGTATEGGGDATPLSPNETRQKGRVIDAINTFGLTGATVTIGGKTVTTNEDGTYEIVVPRSTPYTMSVTSPGHYKLNEQEWLVRSELFDRKDTALLPTDIATVLASLLPPRDPAKGLLVVKINALPPCDSEQGSTLSIEPKGTALVTYFAAGRPNKNATSTTKGEVFSAAFTDVDPGVPLTVTVTSPLCEQVAFPVDHEDATYTGMQKTEPGNVLSYLRVFIGPKKVADAGTD